MLRRTHPLAALLGLLMTTPTTYGDEGMWLFNNPPREQLKAKYPGTKTLDLGLEDGTVAVQLPNKLIFYGIKVPEVVRGGKVGVCE